VRQRINVLICMLAMLLTFPLLAVPALAQFTQRGKFSRTVFDPTMAVVSGPKPVLTTAGLRATRSTGEEHTASGAVRLPWYVTADGRRVAGSDGAETVQPLCHAVGGDDSLRNLLPPCWYERVAGWEIVTFKKHMHYGFELSLRPDELSRQLDEIKSQGIQAIEIFAPAWGHAAYNGLDTVDPFRIDPDLGTMQDFRRAVRMAHSKGLAVVVFINLGYVAHDAPAWIEAQREKAASKDTGKVHWFLWSDKAGAPPPPAQEDIYVSAKDRERDKAYWGWYWSSIAHTYFWSRWKANGPEGKVIPLPQANWGDPSWRQHAAKIVRFWMNTGIDGMLVDAAPSLPYGTWSENRKYITNIVRSYGNVFMDPEGGRDPAWLTQAGYDVLHDYGLSYNPHANTWGKDAIKQAITSGDPSQIESHLRAYHDLVFYSGGVLYSHLLGFNDDPVKRHLQQAVLVGIGDIIVYGKQQGRPDAEEVANLKMKAENPALFPTAYRRQINTNDNKKYYAILKTARDGSEHILAVYNFQPTAQAITVDLSLVSTSGLQDLKTGASIPRPDVFKPVRIQVPAYGYRFLDVLPPRG